MSLLDPDDKYKFKAAISTWCAGWLDKGARERELTHYSGKLTEVLKLLSTDWMSFSEDEIDRHIGLVTLPEFKKQPLAYFNKAAAPWTCLHPETDADQPQEHSSRPAVNTQAATAQLPDSHDAANLGPSRDSHDAAAQHFPGRDFDYTELDMENWFPLGLDPAVVSQHEQGSDFQLGQSEPRNTLVADQEANAGGETPAAGAGQHTHAVPPFLDPQQVYCIRHWSCW